MTMPEAPIEIGLYDPAWPIRFEEEGRVLWGEQKSGSPFS